MVQIKSKNIGSFAMGDKSDKREYCKALCFARKETDSVSEIYNESFYVDIFKNEETMKLAVEYILNNGFASAIPIMSSDQIDNHETCIKFKVNSDTRKIYEMFKSIVSEIDITKYNKMFVHVLNYVEELISDYFNTISKINDDVFYINVKDSVFNAHRCLLFVGNSENGFPIFECCKNTALTKRTDFQLNFGTKATGYVGATYQECPVSFDKYLMTQIPGGGTNLAIDSYIVNYLGSIFTPELFEDYSKFRFALDIEFLPQNKKFVSNEESYNYFNEMITQSRESNDSQMWKSIKPKTLACKMNRIKLVVSGTEAKEEDAAEILSKLVKTITNINIDMISKNPILIDEFKSFVSEHTFYDNVNYVFEADVNELCKNLAFNIVTW
jgi:hypothetical protein